MMQPDIFVAENEWVDGPIVTIRRRMFLADLDWMEITVTARKDGTLDAVDEDGRDTPLNTEEERVAKAMLAHPTWSQTGR